MMRDIHKWKDKVEFSLDTRQVFFLFFGLSIAGCVVFVLGLMTGRSTSWQPNLASLSSSSTPRLKVPNPIPIPSRSDPNNEGVTPERIAPDASPLQNEDPGSGSGSKVRQAAQNTTASPVVEKDIPTIVKRSDIKEKSLHRSQRPTKQTAAISKLSADKVETIVASIAPQGKDSNKHRSNGATKNKSRGPRNFTLMLKSFAEVADARRLADQLKGNGHDVRVESYEARGRQWHRVLLGNFSKWDEGLKAKTEFEKAEHVIAWLIVKPEP